MTDNYKYIMNNIEIIELISKHGIPRERMVCTQWLNLHQSISNLNERKAKLTYDITQLGIQYLDSSIEHFNRDEKIPDNGSLWSDISNLSNHTSTPKHVWVRESEISTFIREHKDQLIEKISTCMYLLERMNPNQYLDNIKLLLHDYDNVVGQIHDGKTQQKELTKQIETLIQVETLSDGRQCFKLDKTRADNLLLKWRTVMVVILSIIGVLYNVEDDIIGYDLGYKSYFMWIGIGLALIWLYTDYKFTLNAITYDDDNNWKSVTQYLGYRPIKIYVNIPELNAKILKEIYRC